MPINTMRRLWHSPVAFPIACVAALLLLVISETSYRQASTSMRSIGEMHVMRTNIQSVWRHLIDAETGQRGFLLTERAEYLKPYRESLQLVDEQLQTLKVYYRGHPEGEPLIEKLAELSKEKLSELSTTLQLREQSQDGAWRDLLMTNIGQEQMEAIRTTASQLLDLESNRVVTEREGIFRILALSRIGVGLMTLISLLAISMYFRQSNVLSRLREQAQTAAEAERDRLEAEVRNRTAQLTELAQHLQTAREDERSRLARELHDELGALLTAAKLDAARLKARLGAMTPEVAERLGHLNKLLNDGIALKRQIIENLRPSSLSNLGLVAALEIVTSEFATASGLSVHTRLEPAQLTPSGELTAYRLVQEALTNIAKYAKATDVWVELTQDPQRVSVCVRDNGCGFDTTQPRHAAHGLLGMRYRVEAEGGEMRLVSQPGQGTSIEARLPIGPSIPR